MKKRQFSEEHRKKISEAKKGKPLSEEHKKKLSEIFSGKNHPWYGKHHSEKSKRKMSETLKNGYKTGKIVHGFKGKHHSEESKNKMRNAHHNKWKGENITYKVLHKWVKSNKPKPEVCEMCNYFKPEVKYTTVEYSKEKNEKRMENEKLPIPNRNMIRLDGVLKKYLEDIKQNPVWHYNYRFWVRGHFRTLRSPRYGDNVGKRIWIPPYVKGKGLLIEKEYVVNKNKEDVDEI